MKYKDELSAFKAGILKTCQDRGVSEDMQDGIMAYVDAQIKRAGVETMDSDINDLIVEPSELGGGAGTGGGGAKDSKGWGTLGDFGQSWKDKPYEMLIKSLPYMLASGLIGAGIGGKKGFGIGGLLGLLGPLATAYGQKRFGTTTPNAVKPVTASDINKPNMAKYPGDPNDYRGGWKRLLPAPKGRITADDLDTPANTAQYPGDPNDYQGEL